MEALQTDAAAAGLRLTLLIGEPLYHYPLFVSSRSQFQRCQGTFSVHDLLRYKRVTSQQLRAAHPSYPWMRCAALNTTTTAVHPATVGQAHFKSLKSFCPTVQEDSKRQLRTDTTHITYTSISLATKFLLSTITIILFVRYVLYKHDAIT